MMEDEILFFLLEGPKSVSDMIRELTEKELSEYADKRQGQIPRIAGNWFKEDGYITSLKEQGLIKDTGRQYAIDKWEFTDRFLQHTGIVQQFPDHHVKGGDAVVADAYERIMPGYTLRRFKRRFRDDILDPDVMHAAFSFSDWREHLFLPDERSNRIATHRLALTFWSSVHTCLLSTLLRARQEQLQDRLEADTNFFTVRERQDALEASITTLRSKIGRRCFPGAKRTDDGAYQDDDVQSLLDSIGELGATLDDDTLEFLSHVYLLYLNDGTGLFTQYSHHDHDEPLLFQLLERGYILEKRKLEQDEETGNFIMPLDHLASYLDDLAQGCTASDAWADHKT